MFDYLSVVRHSNNEHTNEAFLTKIGVLQSHALGGYLGRFDQRTACCSGKRIIATSPTWRSFQTSTLIGADRIDLVPELEIHPRAERLIDVDQTAEALLQRYWVQDCKHLIVVGHHQSSVLDFLIAVTKRFGIALHPSDLVSQKLSMGSALTGCTKTGHIEMFGSYANA